MGLVEVPDPEVRAAVVALYQQGVSSRDIRYRFDLSRSEFAACTRGVLRPPGWGDGRPRSKTTILTTLVTHTPEVLGLAARDRRLHVERDDETGYVLFGIDDGEPVALHPESAKLLARLLLDRLDGPETPGPRT